MVFSCAGCQARYRIDDKLFEGKVLRFSCRKCGQVHLLRDPALGGSVVTAIGPEEAGRSAPAAAVPETRVARPTLSSPTIAAVPAQPAARPAPSPLPPTSTPGPFAARPTTTTRALPAVPGIGAPAAPVAHREDHWFAIKQGQRMGPFTRDALGQQLLEGLLHERSFVWRPTMASWIRMNQVAELGEMLAAYRAEFRERSLAGLPPPLPAEPSASAEIPMLPPAAPAPAPRVHPTVPPVVHPTVPPVVHAPVAPMARPTPLGPGPDLPPPLPSAPPPAASRPVVRPPSTLTPIVSRPAPTTPVPQPPSRRPDGLPISAPRRLEPSAPPPVLPEVPVAPSPAGGRADELFLDLSRPTMDLRMALEVQPEEPPLVARQRRTPAPPRPAPAAPGHVSHEDESPLFPDTLVASEAAWPSFGDGGIAHIHAAAPAAGVGEASHDSHVGVREFSVMVRRLGKQMRTRNLVKVVVLCSIAVFLVGGLVTYLVLARPEGDVRSMSEAATSAPVTRYDAPANRPKVARELPKASILENVDGPAHAAATHPRPAVEGNGTLQAPGAGTEVPYTPPVAAPETPRLAQIDPTARQDSQRYGSLLGTEALRREEAPTDIKPRTLTQMPKSTLSATVMNDFLDKKHRRFVECKNAMKNPPEVPIKVGLSFDVGADGRVGNVQVVPKDGIRDGSLYTCIRNVVLEWAFPAQDESTTYRTVLSL
jgi:hypothetical protein